MAVNNLPVFYTMNYTLKDGALTAEAQLYNDQLWQSLNQVVVQANEGWQLPLVSAADIAIQAADTDVPLGTIWYNTNDNKLDFKVGPGSIERITSS